MSKKIKALIVVLVVTIFASLMVQPFGAVEIKRYYGDIDGDGYITTEDARIALMVAADIYYQELRGLEFTTADINEDKAITTEDALLILKTAAGQNEKRYLGSYEFQIDYVDFSRRINEHRNNADHNLSKLEFTDALNNAASIAATEFATKTGDAFIRQDDSYFYTLLDEKGINYNMVQKIVFESTANLNAVIHKLISDRQTQRAILSENFNKIGVGTYSSDGRNFCWCIILVK